jgi:hypothetical protein
MEEKKTFIIEEMNEEEQKAFNSKMEALSCELEELHQQSIMMAHRAQRDAAHSFLNC